MSRPHLAAAGCVLLLATACADDGADRAERLAATLCPTVQAWSDASVEVAKDFRLASRGLTADQRRARYGEAFAELDALHDRFEDELDGLELPAAVDDGLDGAVDRVQVIIDDGAAEAGRLPDAAYEFVAVREGSLVTGIEKAKAIVFNTLSDLADETTVGLPRGCGRRGALDLSPVATFPS